MNIDEMIARALEEEFEERVEQCCADTKKHRFSLAYRLWERKMLRDLRRGRADTRWTLKRARLVVASGLAAISLLIGGTAFAAVSMGRYTLIDKHEYSKMLIENHPSDKTTLEEYYGLPEEDGWELTDHHIDTHFTILNYKRGDEKVDFFQRVIHEGNMGNINTETADVEIISLYSENDGFLLKAGENGTAIYWIYDGYLLNLSGNITKEEAINLAYSTKIVDIPK